ncbi:MAG: saccharopine dehydrogenase family protein [Kiritimatiellae bacterium]|nr:saccharopine dehydrogenase family protein [Kiritimatiellia bacterium]
MSKVMIIGAGGVSRVVVHKCAGLPEVFGEIVLASRTMSKCEAIAAELDRPILTCSVDADNVPELTALLEKHRPDLVLNVALPYQDLHIMDACLAAEIDYIDTANYEPTDTAKFEYSWQWDYHDRFREAGVTAVLGSGFDPGVTSVFAMYLRKHYFDEVRAIEIVDCNAGDHGQPFATNFNPEINIREVTAKGRYWQAGEWIETEPLSVSRPFVLPEGLGTMNIYTMYHEELESLARHIPELKRARFWMSFSDNYLKHLEVLGNVGMTRIDEVEFKGQKIVPLQFLKALLPDPASLGPLTKGQTCIGCIVSGVKDGMPKRYYIYNICSHEAAYRETNSQAISYTTGVPAMIGAKLVLQHVWDGDGVFNMEEMDPDPFMEDLNCFGLPWKVVELAADETNYAFS